MTSLWYVKYFIPSLLFSQVYLKVSLHVRLIIYTFSIFMILIFVYVTISQLTKLEFNVLDIYGGNYLSWVLDAEVHLDAMSFNVTIFIKHPKQNISL